MIVRTSLRAPRSPRRGFPLWIAVPLALGLAACDLPSELPTWDTTWVVPGESTTIGVSTLLPSSISTSGSSFVLSLPAVSLTQTLGQMCGTVCTSPLVQGQTIPKPAFDFSSSSSIALPGGVNAVTISGGTLEVSLTHDFSFDPIVPSANNYGFIALTATSNGVTIGRDTIHGRNQTFPSGSTITRSVALASPSTVSGPITVSVQVVSPAGGTVTIDADDRLQVSVTPTQVQVSQATIPVTDRTISAGSVELDLGEEGLDETVTERTHAGALLLDIENPFAGTTGTLDLTVRANGSTIDKSVSLAAGTTTARIEFNREEIRTILGSGVVTLDVSGTVSGPAAGVTVTPTQVVTIRSRLELTVGAAED